MSHTCQAWCRTRTCSPQLIWSSHHTRQTGYLAHFSRIRPLCVRTDRGKLRGMQWTVQLIYEKLSRCSEWCTDIGSTGMTHCRTSPLPPQTPSRKINSTYPPSYTSCLFPSWKSAFCFYLLHLSSLLNYPSLAAHQSPLGCTRWMTWIY